MKRFSTYAPVHQHHLFWTKHLVTGRKFLFACVTILAIVEAVQAHAGYPTRPIKLVVPFAVGGTTDLVSRLVAQFVARELGQPVYLENKVGAGGAVGMDAVAKSKPDGYTLGMATVSTHGSNPAVLGNKLKYHPLKDFTPITQIATTPSVLVVNPKLAVTTLQQFIALARANPGRYTYGTPGVASMGHTNMEYFALIAKIQLLHIPYKGSGEAIKDALAGQLDVITDNLPTILPHIQSGKFRALAVLAETRSAYLPDVPTYAELGYPQLGTGGWFGVVAPVATPQPVITKLNQAIHRALMQPILIQKMNELGVTLTPTTPEEFGLQIRQSMELYQRVSKSTRIGLD